MTLESFWGEKEGSRKLLQPEPSPLVPSQWVQGTRATSGASSLPTVAGAAYHPNSLGPVGGGLWASHMYPQDDAGNSGQ